MSSRRPVDIATSQKSVDLLFYFKSCTGVELSSFFTEIRVLFYFDLLTLSSNSVIEKVHHV